MQITNQTPRTPFQGTEQSASMTSKTDKSERVESVAHTALAPYSLPEIPSAKSQPEKVFSEMKTANIFATKEEKERAYQMARLASLMYQDTSKLETIQPLFGNQLERMPSPEDLKIKLPAGLKVQAFRHGNEVVFAIRGTELNADKATLLYNLIADMGIGRHKSDEDLVNSLKKVNQEVFARYGFNIDAHTMQMAESILNTRVKGHNNTERSYDMLGRVAQAFGSGAKKGGIWGTAISGIAAAGLACAGAVAWPVTAPMALLGGLGAATTSGGVKSLIEWMKCLTVADGYPTLQNYIKAIDAYVMAMKEAGQIKPEDSIVTTGHSLAGYLSAVIGSMHADEIFAFNGPGLVLGKEMEEIIKNLGLKRRVQELVDYHSYSMAGDFIGNLGIRSGPLHHLHVPATSECAIDDLPPSHYGSPLAHHGINLMAGVIRQATVQEIPRPLPSAEVPFSEALQLYANKMEERRLRHHF